MGCITEHGEVYTWGEGTWVAEALPGQQGGLGQGSVPSR